MIVTFNYILKIVAPLLWLRNTIYITFSAEQMSRMYIKNQQKSNCRES